MINDRFGVVETEPDAAPVQFLGLGFPGCMDVLGGDAGELITEAYQRGLPHPPGYPTFSMIGHMFARSSWLDQFQPEGASSIAWKLNLMSAVFNAVAGVFIFWTVLLFSKVQGSDELPWVLGGLLASCGYCFSPLVWTYAVTAEVFALNNFFV